MREFLRDFRGFLNVFFNVIFLPQKKGCRRTGRLCGLSDIGPRRRACSRPMCHFPKGCRKRKSKCFDDCSTSSKTVDSPPFHPNFEKNPRTAKIPGWTKKSRKTPEQRRKTDMYDGKTVLPLNFERKYTQKPNENGITEGQGKNGERKNGKAAPELSASKK